ncbi:copper resistance D family protein [Paenibacillus sp. GCM10023252]|uniref:copper resistance D family protein n=1 Tax=Paenibacillus sp. GCM10023252 TaxID=3252649 RepID=UPI00360F4F0D
MIYVSEALLYVCFALLMGNFVLRLVPEASRIAYHVPNGLLIACAVAIPILSFVPLHQSALLFAKDFDVPYLSMLQDMLRDIDAGKAWLWTLIASSSLAVLLGLKSFREDKHMPKVALFILLLLIVWLGYASHAASLYSWKGILAHSAHFLAVTVWVGVMLVASWFSTSDDNWLAFVRLFSPIAIVCLLIAILAGLTLMSFTTPQYLNAMMLPYGQLLLIKHLLLLPLLLFAYTNGFGYKRRMAQNVSFRPQPWLRAESVTALLLFIVSGILGQQTPPHDVKETLQSSSPSPLFTGLYKGSYSPDLQLTLSLSVDSILLAAAAVVLAAGFARMAKDGRLWMSALMACLLAICSYYAFMFAII